jgi:hypothetical protein
VMVEAVVVGDLFPLWPAGSAGKNSIRVQDSKVLALAPCYWLPAAGLSIKRGG